MTALTAPGVYVSESTLTASASATGGAAMAAFFGTAARGPVEPTLISDWPSYKVLFGDIEDAYELGYAVYHYFSNGGRSCYVTRVAAAAAVAANSLTADTEGIKWNPAGGAAATLFDVTANSVGTWGNSLTVQVVQGSIEPSATAFGTFDVVIELGGAEVERWVDCSIEPTSSRYVTDIVNSFSNFITVSNVNPAADTFDAADSYPATKHPLDDGTDGTVADSDYDFSVLDTVVGSLIINVPGVTSTTVIGNAVTKAAARQDSFVIIDPDKTDSTLANIQTTAANFGSLSDPSYAAAYAPALIMVDPSRSGATATRVTSPGGAIAGVMVRTEIARTVAKAPAGYDAEIRGAFAPNIKLTDAQIGTLYRDTVPVNSFKTVAGAGVTINGARTIAKTDPSKFIPVRRTLNYLKYNLKELTGFAVFEPNDERLWERLRQNVSAFLGQFWRQGGLAGANATQAFYVTCDSSNNTPGTIDAGEVHVDVGVALSNPAEFVVLNISQWSGGAASATEAL